MIACIFQRVTVNAVDLKSPGGRSLRVGFLPKLFVTDIPADGPSADEIRRTITHAGPHLLGTTIDWDTHRIDLEPSWPEEVASTWIRGHGRSISWDSLVGDERRITIRLPFHVFAEVESEARIRKQSLNEFCLDAFMSQLRTRSKRIEKVLLEETLRARDPLGTSTSLPMLFNFAMNAVADCSHAELVDGLKRLVDLEYLAIFKYDVMGNKTQYVIDRTSEADFFYRGDFKLRITAKGRPYLDGLRAAFDANSDMARRTKK